jgi:hypothetical protein
MLSTDQARAFITTDAVKMPLLLCRLRLSLVEPVLDSSYRDHTTTAAQPSIHHRWAPIPHRRRALLQSKPIRCCHHGTTTRDDERRKKQRKRETTGSSKEDQHAA